MGKMRILVRWLARAGMLALVGLLCVDAAGRRAAARAPDLGASAVRIVRNRPRACLLLHGWLTTPADFGALPEALAEAGWDVYAPLHAGHGGRPSDLEGVTARDLLDASRERYRRLRGRYSEVALVGFSMGGTIATLLAAEEPPARLVLVAPFYGVRHKWYYVLPARWWQKLLSPCLRYVPRPRGLIRVNRPGARSGIIAYDAYPSSAADALFELRRQVAERVDPARLAVPALLVYSTGDEVCSCAATEEFFSRLPPGTAHRLVFERSNHHVLRDYDGAAAVAGIVEFLRPGPRASVLTASRRRAYNRLWGTVGAPGVARHVESALP